MPLRLPVSSKCLICRLEVNQSIAVEDCQSTWACALYLNLVIQNPRFLEQPVLRSYADCAFHVLKASSRRGGQNDPSETLAYLTRCLVTQLSSQITRIRHQVRALQTLPFFIPIAHNETLMHSFLHTTKLDMQSTVLMLTDCHALQGRFNNESS